jgi:hypothetical protein
MLLYVKFKLGNSLLRKKISINSQHKLHHGKETIFKFDIYAKSKQSNNVAKKMK